jgi:hypothetical protein
MQTELNAHSRKCPEASEEISRLKDCHQNLVRLWAET